MNRQPQPWAAVIGYTGCRSDFRALPWLHTRASGHFCSVAGDAEHQASMITVRLQRRDAGKERLVCTVLLGSQGERESDHESIALVG